MAVPSTPTNFLLQEGNAKVLVTFDAAPTATSYKINRSTDGGVSFTLIATIATAVLNPSYVDSAVTVGSLYYYNVVAHNGSGDGVATANLSIVPTRSGDMTLGQIRLMAQQRADRVNSQFVTTEEWNQYISQSYYELYDLLVTLYEDYYVYQPVAFQTTGASQYPLPDGSTQFIDQSNNPITPPPFYKLLGVDLGLANQQNAWVTLKKFMFVSRNRFVFPQLSTTYLGVFNLRYRIMGNNLLFIPAPSGMQFIRLWYIPRATQLLQDSDILDGVSGWSEYVIVDAAIKALQKEESDVTVLGAQKMMLIKRIEDSAVNRDAGMSESISDVRTNTELWGGYGAVGGDGPYGGF